MNANNLISFILRNQVNRKELLFTFIISILSIILFKHLYPFPDFISDSYNYLETSIKELDVNVWPIGYSRFLSFIHLFTSSHTALIVTQYYILIVCLLYFYYSVVYLFEISGVARKLLYTFLFINPIYLYLSNCVLSDALFLGVSIVLTTSLLWAIFRPKIHYLALQALLIGIAFTLRYTAIYYPIVATLAIVCANYRWPLRVAGIAAPWLLIIPFILFTTQKTKEITGHAEFSVFGAWQIANNALYMYEHIKIDTSKLPTGTENLDRFAKHYFTEVAPGNPPFRSVQGTYFIKMPNAILKPYLYSSMDKDGRKKWTNMTAFGLVSPEYSKYGKWLIKEHPFAFIRYYMGLNTLNYAMPYLEKFGSYNIGKLNVDKEAVDFFKLETDKITLKPSIEFQGKLFYIFPAFFFVLNITFLTCMLIYLFGRHWKTQSSLTNRSIWIAAWFVVVNFGFSVFATPVVLRYQILPMIILLTFNFLLIRVLETKTEVAVNSATPDNGDNPNRPPALYHLDKSPSP